jgi:alkanesulfonate monooxygenase SsuD/methylene tetrahydromethanopterin reductase-like flavin-dependent oxidoreductase (luciferase family)
MKFGIFGGALAADGKSADSQNYANFIDYVLEAEKVGFESVFVVEHHFTGVGQISATLNFLSYLAARTKRIRLGTGVIVMPWHNPVLLAEQISTLDLLSGGRADIGVGRGYRGPEFHGFNTTIEEARERSEEVLDFLINAWKSPERFSHKGKYWTFNDIVVEPAPLQRPHPPLWIGAARDSSIVNAAKRGLNLLLGQLATKTELERMIRLYRKTLAEAGGVYHTGRIGVTRSVLVTETEAEAEAAIESRIKVMLDSNALVSAAAIGGITLPEGMRDEDLPRVARDVVENSAIVGTGPQIIAKLKDLEAHGIDYVLICDTKPNAKTIRDFHREVMMKYDEYEPVAPTKRQPATSGV